MDEKEMKICSTRKRYLIIFLFSSLNFFQMFQWIQYASISNIITAYYDVSDATVSLTSTVFFLTYIPTFLISSYLFHKISLRTFFLIGTTFNLIAAIFKCFTLSPLRFYPVIVAQIIAALSVPFIQPIQGHIARTWFPANEVARATSVGLLGMPLGTAFGAEIPALIIHSSNDKTVISKGLSIFLIGQAVVATIIFILVLYYFDSKPEYPPSYAQVEAETQQETDTFWKSTKAIFSLPNYIIIFFYFGLNSGIFTSFMTVLNLILQRFFVHASHYTGIASISSNFAIIVSTYFYGHYLDKTLRFKFLWIVTGIVTVIVLLSFDVVLSFHNGWLLVVISFILGLFMSSFGSIAFNFAAEVTYPESEGIVGGYLVLNTQIFGFITTTLIVKVLNLCGVDAVFIVYACIAALSLVLGIFVKPDLRRHKANLENAYLMNTEVCELSD